MQQGRRPANLNSAGCAPAIMRRRWRREASPGLFRAFEEDQDRVGANGKPVPLPGFGVSARHGRLHGRIMKARTGRIRAHPGWASDITHLLVAPLLNLWQQSKLDGKICTPSFENLGAHGGAHPALRIADWDAVRMFLARKVSRPKVPLFRNRKVGTNP